jgi:hypothetical protein
MTKASPHEGSTCRRKRSMASRPPAEAPTPTMITVDVGGSRPSDAEPAIDAAFSMESPEDVPGSFALVAAQEPLAGDLGGRRVFMFIEGNFWARDADNRAGARSVSDRSAISTLPRTPYHTGSSQVVRLPPCKRYETECSHFDPAPTSCRPLRPASRGRPTSQQIDSSNPSLRVSAEVGKQEFDRLRSRVDAWLKGAGNARALSASSGAGS